MVPHEVLQISCMISVGQLSLTICQKTINLAQLLKFLLTDLVCNSFLEWRALRE